MNSSMKIHGISSFLVYRKIEMKLNNIMVSFSQFDTFFSFQYFNIKIKYPMKLNDLRKISINVFYVTSSGQ